MFASLFRKPQSISTIRNISPRTQLGIENLEDRTVPSTLVSNLGPTGDGAHLFGRPSSSGVEVKTEQVAVSATGIGRAGDGINLLGGLAGGVVNGRTEQASVSGGSQGGNLVTVAGGARGGVDFDKVTIAGEKLGGVLGGSPGGVLSRGSWEEIPTATSGLAGSPDADGVDGSYQLARVGEEMPALFYAPGLGESALAHASVFAGSLDADGGDGTYETLLPQHIGEEIPQSGGGAFAGSLDADGADESYEPSRVGEEMPALFLTPIGEELPQ
jgi:hypothetical protein